MPNGVPPGSPAAQPPRRQTLAAAVIVLLGLAAIGILAFVLWPKTIDCGTSKTCFLDAADLCGKATVREEITGGTVLLYRSGGCVVTKSIDRFADDELPAVKEALQGKTMACPYDKNSLNPTVVVGLTSGACEGPLMDSLVELQSGLMLSTA